jgi:hypothetical protein
MRLEPTPIAAGGPVTFTCHGCGRHVNQAQETVYADLEGPAFQAYYCGTCAPSCLCGAAKHGQWTAGVHHGAHRCARVVSKL